MTSSQIPEPDHSERTDEVKAFFNQWRVYRTFVEHDYLYGSYAYKTLRGLLERNYPEGFSLIDLGCGDGEYMARTLAGTPVMSYEGVDLSDVALGLARGNMETAGCRCVFTNSDFVTSLQQRETPVDVIWIGLALHHLSLSQKASFLAYCRAALTACGMLVIYEPTLLENETRSQFLARCEAEMDEHWTEITGEEREGMREHINSADFPETVETMREIGLHNGFARVESVWVAPSQLFQVIVFRAS